jgi:hypothetical protein
MKQTCFTSDLTFLLPQLESLKANLRHGTILSLNTPEYIPRGRDSFSRKYNISTP